MSLYYWLKRLSVPHWVTLSKIIWADTYGSMHHWSICLSLCKYHSPLLTGVLVLRSEGVSPPNFVLFQNCFGSSTSFAYPYKFYSHLVKSLPQKKAVWILTAIVWCLQTNLWWVTKTTLRFPIHEHGVSTDFFRTSLISVQ